jgi:hypothetical protein
VVHVLDNDNIQVLENDNDNVIDNDNMHVLDKHVYSGGSELQGRSKTNEHVAVKICSTKQYQKGCCLPTLQKMSPQFRQWCFRSKNEKGVPPQGPPEGTNGHVITQPCIPHHILKFQRRGWTM